MPGEVPPAIQPMWPDCRLQILERGGFEALLLICEAWFNFNIARLNKRILRCRRLSWR